MIIVKIFKSKALSKDKNFIWVLRCRVQVHDVFTPILYLQFTSILGGSYGFVMAEVQRFG